MAKVIPKANKVVTEQPQNVVYMVSIDTSAYLDTETVNGGRISPLTVSVSKYADVSIDTMYTTF